MAAEPQLKPSFSPYRRWGIGLRVCLVVLVVFSVVVMVNYLSRGYPFRFHVSSRTQNPLSPLTLEYLKSLTNQVKVIVYYDKDEELYSTVVDLVNEYRLVNPRISMQIVDYKRDPGAAQQLQLKYSFLAAPSAKNLVIFDCDGRTRKVEGNELAQVTIEQTGDKEAPYRRKLLAFAGERAFNALLLAVTNPKPFNAYFLEGHGEHPIDSQDALYGYLKFAAVLQANNVRPQPLSLLGTSSVPMDCNLLVIGGPQAAIPEVELEKIAQYLNQGGRLLALFNSRSLNKTTGLEKILTQWGVTVGNDVIEDPEHSPGASAAGQEIIVSAFSKHELVNPLLSFGLEMIQPRTISKIESRTPAGAPHVEEIAFSGQHSYRHGDPAHMGNLPMMVAVETAVKGVITERGTTRMVVVGDSFCLANRLIESESWQNHDFAGYVVNWLLDRTELLAGPGPRPMPEYKLVMTRTQLQSAQVMLLAGMPGAALVLGTLVWLRRRR
jgi:hypothetical protein